MPSTSETSLPVVIGLEEGESLLIPAARAGDSEAFSLLFRRYRPRIFALSRNYFAPGADRDDLLQEATIGFFKAVRDFNDGRGNFASFVDLCVRRQIITFVKTVTRQKHSPLNRAVSLDAPRRDDSDDTLLARLASTDIPTVPDADLTEFLNELCRRCSRLEQGILSMYTAGYSFEEMAYELGVHWKAIDNAVWRVKVKARKLLVERPLDLGSATSKTADP